MSDFLKLIFPTPILIGKSDTPEICELICDLAYEFKDKAENAHMVSDYWDFGMKSSNQNDFEKYGVTSFNSSVDLFNLPEWKEVTEFIYNMICHMIKDVNDKNFEVRLINMWTTIYPDNTFVPEHIHSNSYLSGVFYAKAKPHCGGLSLHDPSWVAKTMFMRTNQPEFPNVQTKWLEEAEEGKMILFPSWLPHRSLPNLSGEDRIIVSFNIDFVEIQPCHS